MPFDREEMEKVQHLTQCVKAPGEGQLGASLNKANKVLTEGQWFEVE